MRRYLAPLLAGSLLAVLFIGPAPAENILLNLGSGGKTLAADSISGVEHQRMKCQFGDDGSATDCSHAAPLPVEGATAHDSALSTLDPNPLVLGGDATTSLPTAVADGDAVRLQADDLGRLVVVAQAPRDLVVHQRSTFTTTSEATILTAGASGVFHDITAIILSNSGSLETTVDIKDSTSGTIRLSVDLASDGGGAAINFSPPLTQSTAANNWRAVLSAATSTVYITVVAVKNN